MTFNFVIKRSFKYFLSNKYLISILVIVLLFLVISYSIIQNRLESIKEGSEKDLNILENNIITQIYTADFILSSLATALVSDLDNKNIEQIKKTINAFNPKLRAYQDSYLLNIKILGANDELIACSSTHEDLLGSKSVYVQNKIKNNPDYLAYLNKVKEKYFTMYLEPIGVEKDVRREILPIGIAIANSKHQYIGMILSRISIYELNDSLNKILSYKYFKSIKLYNPNAIEINSKNNVKTIFNIKNILKYNWSKEPFIFYYLLKDYPILIGVELDSDYLSNKIVEICFFCFQYALLFIFFAYFLWLLSNRVYNLPLQSMQKKIFSLPSNIIKEFGLDIDTKLTVKHLAKITNKIIDNYNSFHLIYEEDKLQKPIAELKSTILQLILTEKLSYLNQDGNKDIGFGVLYLNQLKSFLDASYKSYNLLEYLVEISDYCCSYYADLDICLKPIDDNRCFSFKHVALNEAIFSIITFILRIGQFDTEQNKIFLTGHFDNHKNFPTIIIEAKIIESSIKSAGWMLGSSYVYSGLYAIYLLAKENGLFLSIEQQEQQILFILTPLNDERLKIHPSSV